ncbi:hypothetical protein [Methanobrevibacter sp.]|uniref:hypothetical protein n=1 Tax=Methanobrevibacter sp. TaxID=66852 RepID=UPI0026DFFD44|nr:hypothetical protein [Methanobrevibacter sp.]MDO5860826.1 hypothetical protein [Methanobrevibacter sp.]
MSNNDLKIDELRSCFDRENTRKESLQNKASYFLGVVSIVITIICANMSLFSPLNKFFSIFGIIIISVLIISFLLSIGLCAYIFIPKKYSHPFDFKTYDLFSASFKEKSSVFEKNLYDSYLVSTFTNHNLNNKLVDYLNKSILSFIIFLISFVLMVVIL